MYAGKEPRLLFALHRGRILSDRLVTNFFKREEGTRDVRKSGLVDKQTLLELKESKKRKLEETDNERAFKKQKRCCSC